MDNNATDTSSLAESLGLLSLDNLKVFGETSSNSSSIGSRRVSDRLNQERLKAIKTLEKSNKTKKSDVSRNVHQHSTANKENLRVVNSTVLHVNNSTKLSSSAYVPYCRPPTINISELITDESINLESNSKVSFEPSEITGRSTHYTERKSQRMPNSNIVVMSSRLSVGDILASSFAPKARDLCGVLDERTSSANSSTLNSRNNIQLTADMSKATAETSMSGLSSSCNIDFAGGKGIAPFSFTLGHSDSLNSEDFEPAEMMQSKLLVDEIAWAQQFAAIPTTVLSKEANAKTTYPKEFDVQSNPNNSVMAALDPNFSVGRFFNMRSEDIKNIVRSLSPDRMRTPVALVDDTVTSSVMNTPMGQTKVVSSTTSQSSAAPSCEAEFESRNRSRNGKHESKDSGNGTKEDDFNLLSLSSIKKALINGALANVSTNDFLDLLQKTKRSKSPQNRENIEVKADEKAIAKSPNQKYVRKENADDIKMKTSENAADKMKTSENAADEQHNFEPFTDFLSENKENLDPQAMRGTSPRDTMSFTESLLDSSGLKELQRSIGQPRSPLSPLNIPVIRLTPDTIRVEEDIDESPTKQMCINTSRCHPRRSRSPHNSVNENQNKSETMSSKRNSPTNNSFSNKFVSPQPEKHVTKQKRKQNSPILITTTQAQLSSQLTPLCSTRLDENNDNSNFTSSPGLSKTAETKSNIDDGTDIRERTLVQNSSACSGINGGDSNSPLSSPHSYLSSQPTSPVINEGGNQRRGCNHCSPLARNTATGRLQRYQTSPSASESSTNGVAPRRTASSSSLRNGSGGSSGVVRTMSRCSSTSEFSHRDGKLIPLKVTTLELSWGSTRLRSSAHKSMQVKNIASKRLALRVEIHGPGYQLVNMHSNMLTLQSQECRTIIVSFCPTVIGAAIGRLSFHAPQSMNNATCSPSFLDIPLYGYGGHSSIVTQDVHVGPLGMPFLQMGFLHELVQPLERTIKIFNKGPLLGFALATIDSVGLRFPRLCSAFEMQRSAVLIPAGSHANIRIVFRPQREDVRKITRQTKTVLTLANLRLVSGDEATRQRMRQLVHRMSLDDRAKLSPSNALQTLWSEFPAEVEMPELKQFKEQPSLAFDMLSHMRVHEVALTINDDAMDETIKSTSSMYFPDDDETVLFRTVCSPSPSVNNGLGRVDELTEEVEVGISSTREACWSVVPDTLTFYMGTEGRLLRASFFICNSFKSRQYFEVTSNAGNLLQLTPSDGYVEPDGGHLEVEVCLQLEKFTAHKKVEFMNITVCMENERIVVPVKLSEKSRPNQRAVRNACV